MSESGWEAHKPCNKFVILESLKLTSSSSPPLVLNSMLLLLFSESLLLRNLSPPLLLLVPLFIESVLLFSKSLVLFRHSLMCFSKLPLGLFSNSPLLVLLLISPLFISARKFAEDSFLVRVRLGGWGEVGWERTCWIGAIFGRVDTGVAGADLQKENEKFITYYTIKLKGHTLRVVYVPRFPRAELRAISPYLLWTGLSSILFSCLFYEFQTVLSCCCWNPPGCMRLIKLRYLQMDIRYCYLGAIEDRW